MKITIDGKEWEIHYKREFLSQGDAILAKVHALLHRLNNRLPRGQREYT